MSIRTIRDAHNLTGSKLRRARRLFVFLNRNNIKTTIDLRMIAARMQEAGLYAEKTGPKDVRFAVLRRLWMIEHGRDWHRWCEVNGWAFGSFTQTKKVA